jgi:3-oxoacyl-(acyl-carrier-protein) synthase
VTAPKAAYGETFGASGPLAAAVALVAMTQSVIPATPGADPASAPVALAAVSRPAALGAVLVNAFHPDRGAWVSLALTRKAAEA